MNEPVTLDNLFPATAQDTGEELISLLFSGENEVLFSDEEGVLPDSFAGNKAPALGRNGRIGIQLLPENAFDPDSTEYFVFMSIFSAINYALGKRPPGKPGKKASKHQNLQELALEWLFVPNEQDSNGLSFDLGCASLDARPNLIRTRLHFEFYKRMMSGFRLPFLSCRLPDRFRLEGRGVAGDLGEDMLSELWMQPGYRADLFREIIAPSNDGQFNAALDGLDANGNLAIKNGLVYFTGRNPITMKFGSRFNWTHLTGLD